MIITEAVETAARVRIWWCFTGLKAGADGSRGDLLHGVEVTVGAAEIDHAIRHDVCGKIIVATEESELPQVQKLYERGLENGLNVSLLDQSQLQEIEPHARGVRATR